MPETLRLTASDGTSLAAERAGEGRPIVLLHGLTASRRYVVMGSRLLERSGRTVISYDARGHGESAPAAARAGEHERGGRRPDPGLEAAYGYATLAGDLENVLDALGIEQAVLVGASMGAHTVARFALRHADRVTALALITPAYDADTRATAAGAGDALEAGGAMAGLPQWDALAAGLRNGGVEGFLEAYDFSALPEAWRGTLETVVRQRLGVHRHPEAVAEALEAVPRSRPFETMSDLRLIAVPTLIVGSRDEADPGHPLAVAERYAALIPRARLLVEPPGSSPIAWQGGQLSKAILEHLL